MQQLKVMVNQGSNVQDRHALINYHFQHFFIQERRRLVNKVIQNEAGAYYSLIINSLSGCLGGSVG